MGCVISFIETAPDAGCSVTGQSLTGRINKVKRLSLSYQQLTMDAHGLTKARREREDSATKAVQEK